MAEHLPPLVMPARQRDVLSDRDLALIEDEAKSYDRPGTPHWLRQFVRAVLTLPAAIRGLETLVGDQQRLLEEADDVTLAERQRADAAVATSCEKDALVARLREIVRRYGDPVRMATAPAYLQQEIDDALSPEAGSEPAWRPTHRHVKRGTTYRVLGTADVQANTCIIEGERVTVYQGEDRRLWVRPTGEFEDGRFAPIAPDPETPHG